MSDLMSIFNTMDWNEDAYEGMTYNSRVLLVDAMNLFIRSYSAVPSMDDDGNHIGGMVGFLKSLGYVTKTFKPTRVIVVFDGKGGSQRRRKIYPEYKQNRKPPIRLNRQYDLTTDEQEKENMKFQLVTLVEILEQLPVTIFALDNVEADDVIAHLSPLVDNVGGHSIIYSTDKDFLQLASESVKIYNPVKKKTYTVDTVVEEYGIHPKHFHFFRALDGDKSDNIDGVKGVGAKRILKYLPEIADPTVDVNYDYIKSKYLLVKKIPKMISSIIDNKDIIDRNLKLMNLHEGIMSSDARIRVSEVFYNDPIGFNKYELTKRLMSARLLSAFPNYDSWLASTFIPLNRFSE